MFRHGPLPVLLALAGGIPAFPVTAAASPVADHIVVRKGERTLTLYSGATVLRRIAGLQFGPHPTGPKRYAGDGRTPEGHYRVDWGNPDSAYHLSLHVSYPDAADRARAAAAGRSPGGLIFLHGQPNDWTGPGRAPGDWTDGCIALADEEIEAVWQAVPDGTPIDILP